MKKSKVVIFCFEESASQSNKLARAMGVDCLPVGIHHFPDEESLVTVPTIHFEHVIFYRSLNKPNSKLIELLLAAKTARKYGAKRLTLIAPYLCYMRQDCENHPGEAISQQIVGELLASLFDDVITVDAHLHRISRLEQAIPVNNAINILATNPIAKFIAGNFSSGLILGPDVESEQWVKQVADKIGFSYAVASKVRQGDRDVTIQLDKNKNYSNRDIIILDDMASTGRTIGQTASLLKQAGTRSVSAIVSHALFSADAKSFMLQNHVSNIWSTDSIKDSSNVIELTEIIATALENII